MAEPKGEQQEREVRKNNGKEVIYSFVIAL